MKFSRIDKKIALFLVLGLIFVAGLVFAGYKLEQSHRFRASVLPISCQNDSDCILAIERKACCRCPYPANKIALKNKNLIEYLPGEMGWSQIIQEECKSVQCSPCPWWTKAVCESGLCKGKSEGAVSIPVPPEDFNIYYSFGFGGKIYLTQRTIYM